jgi:lipoprotein signal peptidase
MTDKLLKILILVGVVTYSLWQPILNYTGLHIFYIGNALFIFLLALYIRQTSKESILIFFLFCGTLNNLIDELLFDPQKFGINEIIATVLIPIAYYLKSNNNA